MKKYDLNIIAGVVGMYDIAHAPPSGDSLAKSLIGNHNRGNFALYAQVDKRFFKRLNTTIGARWEYFNVDDTLAGSKNGRKSSLGELKYPLGRLGLNYQAADATFIRASAGMAFRYPSLAEMYVSTRVGPVSVYSNPNLKPEKGYSAEVGLKQGFKIANNWVGYGDVALFWNQYQDMMEFTFGQFGTSSDPLFGLGFSSQNIGTARILGTDISAGLQGKVGDFTLNFLAGYTFIDARSLNWNDTLHLFSNTGAALPPETYASTSSSKVNFLKYRPRNQLKIVFSLAYKFFEFNADYQYLGFQENIDEKFVSSLFASQSAAFGGLANYRNAQIANGSKGDNILNAGIAFKATKKFKIAAIVKNVTNTQWMARPGMFQAPRNYTLQLSYTL
jgi:iron complex outermembrane receptor protein